MYNLLVSLGVLGAEERYIWVLAPSDRGGHVGEHYLVVQPIVEAGVKSVNASVSVTSIAAQCKYWNESQSAWSEAGCRVSTSHLMSNSQISNIGLILMVDLVFPGWPSHHPVCHSVPM